MTVVHVTLHFFRLAAILESVTWVTRHIRPCYSSIFESEAYMGVVYDRENITMIGNINAKKVKILDIHFCLINHHAVTTML